MIRVSVVLLVLEKEGYGEETDQSLELSGTWHLAVG